MKYLSRCVVILMLIVAVACDSDEGTDRSSGRQQIDVYVAGQFEGDACYWKNGGLHPLDDNSADLSEANKLFVENDDVHVWGRTFNGALWNGSQMYWKNGARSLLNQEFDEADYSLAIITDFHVAEGVVYFLGYLASNNQAGVYDLVYWQDGEKHILVEGTRYTNAYARIVVLNEDVYVLAPNEENQMGLFTNSTFQPLDEEYLCQGLAIGNGQAYVYGSIASGQGFYRTLTSGFEIVTPYGVNDLSFNGEDVYTINDFENRSFRREIRRNGESIYVTPAGFESHIDDIVASGDSLYAIVNYLQFGNTGPSYLMLNDSPQFILDSAAVQDFATMNDVFISDSE